MLRKISFPILIVSMVATPLLALKPQTYEKDRPLTP